MWLMSKARSDGLIVVAELIMGHEVLKTGEIRSEFRAKYSGGRRFRPYPGISGSP